MTIEEKAKAYDEALEKSKRLYEQGTITESLCYVFPELKESEDEKIKEQVVYAINQLHVCECTKDKLLTWLEKKCDQKIICDEDADILQRFSFYSYKDEPDILYLAEVYVNESNRNQGIGTKILDIADKVSANIGCKCIRLKAIIGSDAEKLYRKNGYNTLEREGRTHVWLEKQGSQNLANSVKTCKDEQNPADKVEPKFKVGDWIINRTDATIMQIINNIDFYESVKIGGQRRTDAYNYVEWDFRLWTIQDAKEGDVLAEHETIVLFKKIEGLNIRCYCTYHYLGYNPTFYVDTLQNKTPYRPATKEQRDLLFQKMKEAGYEWDADKKELKLLISNGGDFDSKKIGVKRMKKCVKKL